MDRIVISRGYFDGKPLPARLALFSVMEGAFGWLCLPHLFTADFHAPAFWVALTLFVAGSVFFILIFFNSKTVDLLLSRPPVVVTTTTWFGKYVSVEQETLEGAAWVQVSHNIGAGDDNGPYLSVEIVQPRRWATVTSTHDDSPEGREVAISRCTELATLLGLKDVGYRG